MLQIILVIRPLHYRIIDFCAFNINPCHNIRINFGKRSKIHGRPVDIRLVLSRLTFIFLSIAIVFGLLLSPDILLYVSIDGIPFAVLSELPINLEGAFLYLILHGKVSSITTKKWETIPDLLAFSFKPLQVFGCHILNFCKSLDIILHCEYNRYRE